MQKRNALGRGLDSLIGISEVQTAGGSAINEIELTLIQPNPDQPRETFDDETLKELATSIRELGIVQPLSLRMLDDGSYQIIAGERRWRAARMAGLRTVPAYVRTASDSEVTEMALIENIQREDLSAIEVALAFRKLIDSYNLTQEKLSERIGKNRATITNHLRLLKLPAEIQLGLRNRKIDMGHARALLSISNPKVQLKLYNRILKEGLSVRRVEELAREAAENEGEDTPKHAGASSQPSSAMEKEFARDLESCLRSPVKYKRRKDGVSTITITLSNDEELSRLVERLQKLQ